MSQPSLITLLQGGGSATTFPHAAAVPLRLPAPDWLSALGCRLEVSLAASQAESCLLPAAVLRHPGGGGGAQVYGPARAARSVTLPLWQLGAAPINVVAVGDLRCSYHVRCGGKVGTGVLRPRGALNPGLWGTLYVPSGQLRAQICGGKICVKDWYLF